MEGKLANVEKQLTEQTELSELAEQQSAALKEQMRAMQEGEASAASAGSEKEAELAAKLKLQADAAKGMMKKLKIKLEAAHAEEVAKLKAQLAQQPQAADATSGNILVIAY